jgi:hypothetical protein
MSNRLRVIQLLSDIINEKQEETDVRTFSAQQDVANLRVFVAGSPTTNFSVQLLSPGTITIEGKGAVTYQIHNPIALVPVFNGLDTRISYRDFSHVNPESSTVTSQIKTVEASLFSQTFWLTYLQRLKGGLSANFQTLDVDRGVILKDPNNRPILLPSFVYVQITKGPSFFRSAAAAARMGAIREGEDVYTVTMFPANFAQLARLAFTKTAIREGENVYLLSPVAAFEEALRLATRSIGEVAKAGGKDVEKRNLAGALMPGTGESVEVARAVALAALARALRDNAASFKVVQFQIKPDAEGRLNQNDFNTLLQKLNEVYRMVIGALTSAVNMFNSWANSSIASAQWEALRALTGEAPDAWPAARVSQPAQIMVSGSINGPWTVSTKKGISLKEATAEAKYRPIPALVEGSLLIRAKEGGGAVFSTIADTLLYSMNAIGHNWDVAARVLAAFNEKWDVWSRVPSFFDEETGKLRPLSDFMTLISRDLLRKRAALKGTSSLNDFETEVMIILH